MLSCSWLWKLLSSEVTYFNNSLWTVLVTTRDDSTWTNLLVRLSAIEVGLLMCWSNVSINLPRSFCKFKTKLTWFSFRKTFPVFSVWVICKYKISQNVSTSYVKKLLRYICKFLITKFTSAWHGRLRWTGFDWSQNTFQCGGDISQAGEIRVRGFNPALSLIISFSRTQIPHWICDYGKKYRYHFS